MKRDLSRKVLGGVLSGISNETGVSLPLLRVLFLVGFFAIGGITFGITSGAMTLIYVLFWMLTPAN
jgi:phage shock protein PspC (stress-responsive transcriptional regulator)